MRSIIEEYKRAKVRLAMMMRDSSDSIIARDSSRLKSGCKRRAKVATDHAIAGVQFNETCDAVQSGRAGIGYGTPHWRWS